jgi:hypothetical protein
VRFIQATIAVSIVAWATAEWMRRRGPRDRDVVARAIWTAGVLLLATHTLAAFHIVHGWSHRAAAAETARQTAALTGIDWGGGIFVNYAFLAVWAADAGWWWASPDSYRSRSHTIETAVFLFFVFMFVNGAIVFAHGAMRVLGAAAVTLVLLSWYRSKRD